jgi:Trypsin-co-occurring domain 1
MLVTPLDINGTVILVEVEEQRISVEGVGAPQGELAGVDEHIQKLADFGESLTATCVALHGAMKKATQKVGPNEMQLEFGLKLGGEAGVPFVAKGKAEANFLVRLTWSFAEPASSGSVVEPSAGGNDV